MKGNGDAYVPTHVETRFEGVAETGLGQLFIGDNAVFADGADDELLLGRIFPPKYHLVMTLGDLLLP